ncbi:unnamed protein product [Trifolium pratense]|uniref:Uncharacterized protein n=1 Tax=Trifolium pratense TaxID=57577 RepID=A0ACB0M4U2_TRIPR|nr:unnamed protein product [Trifolium pratense]
MMVEDHKRIQPNVKTHAGMFMMGNASVNDVHEGETFIEDIKDEIDPDHVSLKTPSNKTGASLISHSQSDEVEDVIDSKLSSTKMMKFPKKE